MTQLRQVKPMLATSGKTKDKWNNADWIAEEKLDGSRYICQITEEGNFFTSRRKSTETGRLVNKTENVPHLSNVDLKDFAGTILDGEMRHEDFSKTISVMGSNPDRAIEVQEENGYIDYFVFDIIQYLGKDVTDEPLFKRRILLKEVLNTIIARAGHRHFRAVNDAESDKKQFYKEIVENGGEGVILKHLDGKYSEGSRSRNWIKVKKSVTEDVVITGATKPTIYYGGKNKSTWDYWIDTNEGGVFIKDKDTTVEELEINDCRPITKHYYKGWIGSIKYGMYIDGELVELGQTSGINEKMKKKLSDGEHGIKEEYLNTVMEIKAMEQMESGAFRHPTFVRLRPDKDPKECKLEE